MRLHLSNVRRISYGLLTVLALSLSVVPALEATVSAGQVTSRSIQMSDATVSATGVNYGVAFTPAATGARSIIIDFCQNSSIIGGACTTTNGVTFTSPALTGFTGGSGWSVASSTGSSLKLTSSTALTTAAVSFTVTGVNNPTGTSATAGAAGTFYARLVTYTDTAATGYTNAGSVGTPLDYGGFAFSTSAVVNISATIMETLTFCVSAAAPGTGCTSTTAPNLTLGHGTPLTLDSSATDTATAYTQLSSNAVNGADVRLKVTSSTTCAGLSRDSGATCPIAGKGAFGAIAAGNALFGLNVANGTGGSGTVTANANYGTTAGSYGMGTATYSGFGDIIQASTAATANVNSTLTYAASAATTTPAGVYSATHSLIGTGKF